MLLSHAMTELFAVQEIFVSGLGDVEDLGDGTCRFTFFTRDRGENIAQVKLVAPMTAVPPALMLAAEKIGCKMVAVCAKKQKIH